MPYRRAIVEALAENEEGKTRRQIFQEVASRFKLFTVPQDMEEELLSLVEWELVEFDVFKKRFHLTPQGKRFCRGLRSLESLPAALMD